MTDYIIIGAICIVILGFIGVIIMDSLRFHVVEYTIPSNKIIKEKTFVVMSDLHCMVYGRDNSKLLSAVFNSYPDAVLIPGDMITAKPNRKTDRVIMLLDKIKERIPIFYSMGNHEYRARIYPKVYGKLWDEYEKELSRIHISIMDNSTETFDEIHVTGVTIDKEYYKRFHGNSMSKEYLDSVIGKPDRNKLTILLAHNPDYFEAYRLWGADIILSGHVHGGVIRIPGIGGLISPTLRPFPKYDGGVFAKGKSTMIVSRGLGMHTIPLRMFNPGELIVLHVVPRKD